LEALALARLLRLCRRFLRCRMSCPWRWQLAPRRRFLLHVPPLPLETMR
jgi:hypothetical protein